MTYFLGVDIGTTSLKAIAFDSKGEVIYTHSAGYQIQHPQPHFSEQSTADILRAVISSINKVIEMLLPGKPAFISFSAMMHSLIAIDSMGQPLTECIIWADNRAASIAEELRLTDTGKRFYHDTGVPLHAMSPLCKILWLKKHDPGVFEKAQKFIGIKEFIFLKLFNKYVVDAGLASTTGMLNLRTLQWDKAVLHHAGISEEQLSEVKDTTSIFYYNSNSSAYGQDLLIPEGLPVIIGSSDGALANIGSGALSRDSMAITIGTSSAVRILAEQPYTDGGMRTFCYHATGSSYITGGASNNGAVVLQWLRDSLLQTDKSIDELLHDAASVPPGSDGLLFLPFILGERAPIWNSNATGSFFGLTIHHTQAHMVRAAVEGVVFCVYSIGRIIEEWNKTGQIHASGGFAQSSLWLQIVADTFNKTVVVSDAKDNSALGAVLLGMKALNIKNERQPGGEEVYTPCYERHEQYRKAFDRFERIYQLVKNEYVAAEELVPTT
ncbi:MAG TPA: gluconokinase [Chitinophagaceae bacterium]|nr:gluconokinase [Chitinophagaceae bacterium]